MVYSFGLRHTSLAEFSELFPFLPMFFFLFVVAPHLLDNNRYQSKYKWIHLKDSVCIYLFRRLSNWSFIKKKYFFNYLFLLSFLSQEDFHQLWMIQTLSYWLVTYFDWYRPPFNFIKKFNISILYVFLGLFCCHIYVVLLRRKFFWCSDEKNDSSGRLHLIITVPCILLFRKMMFCLLLVLVVSL